MLHFLLTMILSFVSIFAFGQSQQERFVKHGQVELWTETFGKPNDPAILLIMGAGSSAFFIPDVFCKELSESGYFVIRYDHRDVGKSSLIDYAKHPYTLDDLALDALAILDSYKIPKAHVVGLSMGGFIGQILAIKYPERLNSLVSMMSSPDHSVIVAYTKGEDTNGYSLPPPAQEAMDTWSEMKRLPANTPEERIALKLKNWKLCAGAGYDEEECRDMEVRTMARTKRQEAIFNHWSAMASWPCRLKELESVTTPTLVIHGGGDVVLPPEHGIATAKAIPGSQLIIIPGMGHMVNKHFSHEVASYILLHVRKAS